MNSIYQQLFTDNDLRDEIREVGEITTPLILKVLFLTLTSNRPAINK